MLAAPYVITKSNHQDCKKLFHGVNEINCPVGTSAVTDKELSSSLGGVNSKLGLWKNIHCSIVLVQALFGFYFI